MTSASDWLLALEDEGEDLSSLWPEVFSLPGGGAVDLAFATEWPLWMKQDLIRLMQECFQQPFWSGINDTTAQGIATHVRNGVERGLSMSEIRDEMVGDGLDEFYHNRGMNIARTETGNALNGARESATRRLQEEVPGLKIKRVWNSVLGNTTRDTHADLDGVPADADGGWMLGGVWVPWPAHWSLDPGERCNCLCTVVIGWGMPDDEAEKLIDEYNQRLEEARTEREKKSVKGDLPGHPFRGNQWTGGGGRSSQAVGSGPRDVSDLVRSNVPLNKGVHESRVVEIEEEGKTRKCVFKPTDGDNPELPAEFKGKQSSNEVAAAVLSDEMNLGIVPRTEKVVIDGREGSLQDWVNRDSETAGSLSDREGLRSLRDVEGLDDMVAFDVLTGNADRHLKNWLVKDGKAVLIDNGMSMAENLDYADYTLRSLEHDPTFRRKLPISQGFREGLGRILDNRSEVDAKLEAAGVGDSNRRSFWKRAEYMQKLASQPLLGGKIGYEYDTLRDMGRLSEGLDLYASFRDVDIKGDTPGHPFRGNQWDGGQSGGEQKMRKKTKAEIAKASAVRVDKEIQQYAEEKNEKFMAESLGGESLPDNEPVDVEVEIGEPPKLHGIELKTMVVSNNRKVTMKKDAQERKRSWERKNKASVHTVVIDDTEVFNAKGPGKHDVSKRRIFYRRGYGSFRVDGMHEVKGGTKELKELMSANKRNLPSGAKGIF